METVIQNPQTHKPNSQSQNEQAKDLFDDLSISQSNPFQNLQLSSQIQQSEPIQENVEDDNKSEAINLRQMMLISKKQKKKEKKMRKFKQAKERKQSKKQNRNENIKKNQISNHKPSKKMLLDSSEDEAEEQSKLKSQNSNLKIKKSSKKVIKNSDDEDKSVSNHSEDSDEYSSNNEVSQENEQGKMDPHSQQQGSGKKEFKKKLGKKSRKQRILQKQGFDLRELGNDVQANYELNSSVNQSDDSYSDGGRKKKGSKRVKKEKKQKKPKLTNQQFLGKLQELGCQDQIDENDPEKYNYDSGLNQLQKLRPKKESHNKIKVQNKLFQNFNMDIEEEQDNEDQMPMPQEKLQLEIKPKSTNSSKASSFLNKVETLKKHRGLEADINQEEFDKITKEKAKRSISQLMTKIQNQVEENEEIDIQIKAPTIAKGKSADLINNTMFIVKNLSHKQSSTVSSSDNPVSNQPKNASNQQVSKPVEKPQQQKVVKNQSVPVSSTKGRKGVSRLQFFKQIKESINVRKSKYISDEELKNSMKASKLQELEEIRKKIEEKRRKEAMYELGELDDDAENVINELQEDLAKHNGITRADFKKLIRMEEGLEGLDEYEEEADKKNKKQAEESQQPKVVLQLSVQQVANPCQDAEQKPSPVEQSLSKKVLDRQRELRIQKALAMQGQRIEQESSNRHADDMIDDYEGDEFQQKDQMDLENQGDDEADEAQELEDQINGQNYEQLQSVEDQQEEEQQYQDEKQQENPSNEPQPQEQSPNPIQSENLKLQENPSLRKQLEQQGIIMPGKNKKNQQSEINFSKYLLQTQNLQPVSQALNQPPAQSFKIDEEALEFKEFKKLRKIAVIIQEKKKKRQEQLKRAKEFFEQQAQLGSDNQENDDNVKAINRKDDEQEEDGDHLDQELEQLIDNAVDINEADEQQAFKKYMQDVKEKDRQQLQKILRGEFRRPNHDMPEMQQMEQDQRDRIQRMQRMVQWMKKRQDDEKDLYAKDDSQDDEMNYYYDYNGKKKKIQHRRNPIQDNEEDSPEQDNGQLQKKLQFYLMDTISPAKKQTQVQINTDLITELPTMNKKSTISRLNNFAQKSQQHQNNPEKSKDTPTKAAFAGNLLSLAAAKGENNHPSMPKMKKTSSHMSEYLNKNKTQKPNGFTSTSFKLPGIFNRLVKK